MKNILFVNSVHRQCGVNSYGDRSFEILRKSDKYDFIYCMPTSMEELQQFVSLHEAAGVIVNYHTLTLPWYNTSLPVKQLVLFHEGSRPGNFNPTVWLNVDCTIPDHGNEYAIPRPIIESPVSHALNKIPLVGSFGFSFGDKGFGRIVQMVNDQFDEAVIRLHMPRAYYGDRNGEARAGVIPGCLNEMRKDGIKLEISDEWMDDSDLINFLSENDLNVFLYDEMKGRGLSSVIDYAISVDTPLAINDSWMFRHIQKPEINVAHKTLKEIIDGGSWPLQEFRELWGNKNFLEKYEHILDTTL